MKKLQATDELVDLATARFIAEKYSCEKGFRDSIKAALQAGIDSLPDVRENRIAESKPDDIFNSFPPELPLLSKEQEEAIADKKAGYEVEFDMVVDQILAAKDLDRLKETTLMNFPEKRKEEPQGDGWIETNREKPCYSTIGKGNKPYNTIIDTKRIDGFVTRGCLGSAKYKSEWAWDTIIAYRIVESPKQEKCPEMGVPASECKWCRGEVKSTGGLNKPELTDAQIELKAYQLETDRLLEKDKLWKQEVDRLRDTNVMQLIVIFILVVIIVLGWIF